MKEYYKILEVSEHSTQEEIKRSYRRLAKKYHPDRSSYEQADKLFAKINEAYEVLGSKEKRKQYDNQSAQRTSTTNQGYSRPSYARPSGSGGQRPRYKRAVKFDVSPYVHYFKLISKITFGFCLILILDYVIPAEQIQDRVRNRTVTIINSRGRRVAGGLQLNLVRSGSIKITKDVALLIPDGLPATVFKTRILRKITKIDFALGREQMRYYVGASIYRNFSFTLLILTITSAMGIWRNLHPESALNIAVANVIISFIVLYLVTIS